MIVLFVSTIHLADAVFAAGANRDRIERTWVNKGSSMNGRQAQSPTLRRARERWYRTAVHPQQVGH